MSNYENYDNKDLKELEMAELFSKSMNSMANYMSTKEVEKTERERIRKCFQVIMEKIDGQNKRAELVLEYNFKDKQEIYNRMDKLIDASIKNGDSEMAKLALDVMLKVFQKSPSSGLSDAMNTNDVEKPLLRDK